MGHGGTTSSTSGSKFLRRRTPPAWSARRSLAVLGGAVGLLIFLSPLLGENGLPAYLRLRKERDELRERVQELRVQQDRLQQDISSLQEDPARLERLARERYNMHRPGEEVLEIVGPETPADPSP